ncbi:hypothetical protein CDL12_00663 [Handroanthus impetiginosus]|uniref:Uncharacterized protein n=1 Tax=Handroanthus impetiginosus TaxID=429701 RepID=A0A2G9IA12_9LAMI|nr:hypothetical protein CDL12_00663 [Handroanthus impetiginosus]
MEIATIVALFVFGLLVSFTRYTLNAVFGQLSQQLRDSLEKHRD